MVRTLWGCIVHLSVADLPLKLPTRAHSHGRPPAGGGGGRAAPIARLAMKFPIIPRHMHVLHFEQFHLRAQQRPRGRWVLLHCNDEKAL